MFNSPAHKYPSVSSPGGPCSLDPCLNGGTCEEHDGTFTCYCHPDWTGDVCERESLDEGDVAVASFGNGGRASYVELKPLSRSAEHKLSVDIEFRSETANGMLVYTQEYEDGSGDYAAIAIVDG